MPQPRAVFDPNTNYLSDGLETLEEFDPLTHYGVPGMKWGRRKGSDSRSSKMINPATGRPAPKQRVVVNSLGQVVTPERGAKLRKASKKTEQRLAKSKTAYLSDAELKKRIDRLNMEKSYAKLTHQKSKLERGQEAAKIIVGLTASATTVYKFAKSPAGQAIAGAIIKQGTGRHRL